MAPATRTRKETLQTHEELELREYGNADFTPYVHDFMARESTKCKRCQGLMMRDCESYAACRCVQCGDVVDPIILKNRANSGLLSAHEYKGLMRPRVHEHITVLQAISSGRY